MKKISIIIILLTCKILFSQELTLKDLKVEEFYNIEETENNVFKNSINNIETFSNEDINLDFSNIKDLTFLKNISKENKIVMLGETHYSKNISSLRNRIFFALNSFDYYPLIIIENSYSITEYSNYYIHIKDENEAKYFLENELSNFLYTEDDLIFLNQLRSWNNKSEKQLSIGGSDLEFSYSNVLEKILKPYFYKLKNVDKSQIDKIIELGKNQSNEFFIEIIPYLKQSKAENIIGNYSFINSQYISNIITNFNSTNNAFNTHLNIIDKNLYYEI